MIRLSIGVAVTVTMVFFFSANILQTFTSASAVSTMNNYGLKAEVIKPDRTGILCVCPYWIGFHTDKMVQIYGFQVCKDSNCVSQNTPMALDPNGQSGSHLRTAIINDNVPWLVGDSVGIRVKVSPLYYCDNCHGNGGDMYHVNPTEATWLDLGTTQVTTNELWKGQ